MYIINRDVSKKLKIIKIPSKNIYLIIFQNNFRYYNEIRQSQDWLKMDASLLSILMDRMQKSHMTKMESSF